MAVLVVGAGLIPARFSLSFRQKISRKSATAHSPNRYGALHKGTKFVTNKKISDHETFSSNFIICPEYFILCM